MSKTNKKPSQEVLELIDRLGKNMSDLDFIEFLEDVESLCEVKRMAMEEQIEAEEDPEN